MEGGASVGEGASGRGGAVTAVCAVEVVVVVAVVAALLLVQAVVPEATLGRFGDFILAVLVEASSEQLRQALKVGGWVGEV